MLPAETAVPVASKANEEALDATGTLTDNIEVPPLAGSGRMTPGPGSG
jgi:hypothetical protein